MKIGVTLRNMGVQSTPDIMIGGATAAEALGFDSVWITDHIAIPPDDAEGSGGRYLDTLTTLAWLGGATRSIKLGSGVLILPYRPVLPTAKQVATVQEITGDRLLLGVGIGWMDAEFRALGVPRSERAARSDELLAFLNEAFANDVVERHGQDFLFKPRPRKPDIYVGGRAPHALARALRFDLGWIPMSREPASLAAHLETYRQMADDLGKPVGPVTVMTGLPLDDPARARDWRDEYAALGVERLVLGGTYETLDQYKANIERIAELTL